MPTVFATPAGTAANGEPSPRYLSIDDPRAWASIMATVDAAIANPAGFYEMVATLTDICERWGGDRRGPLYDYDHARPWASGTDRRRGQPDRLTARRLAEHLPHLVVGLFEKITAFYAWSDRSESVAENYLADPARFAAALDIIADCTWRVFEVIPICEDSPRDFVGLVAGLYRLAGDHGRPRPRPIIPRADFRLRLGPSANLRPGIFQHANLLVDK